MAYADIYAAATDPDHVIRKQITVAVQHAAADIVAESESVPDHASRLTWARRARLDPVSVVDQVIWRALEEAGPVDLTSVSDNNVQQVVSAIVNDFALG